VVARAARREQNDVNVTTLTEEITTTSPDELIGTSFISSDEAVAQAIARASARLSGVHSVEVKSVEVMVGEGGNIAGYRVTLQVHHAGEAEPGLEQEGESALPLGPLPLPLRADEEGVVRVGETRVPLDAVVSAFRLGETAEGIAEQYPSLRLDDVYLVLGYYLDYQEAVDGYIARREDEATRLREEIEADFDPTGLRARLLARRER
jgi:flavin-binding protein dodecin/uncharacterized protein (DUF433 family)